MSACILKPENLFFFCPCSKITSVVAHCSKNKDFPATAQVVCHVSVNHKKEFHMLQAGNKSNKSSCWSDFYSSEGRKTSCLALRKKEKITRGCMFLDVFVRNIRSQDGTRSTITSFEILLCQRLVHNQQRLEFFSKIKMNRQVFLHTYGLDIIWRASRIYGIVK